MHPDLIAVIFINNQHLHGALVQKHVKYVPHDGLRLICYTLKEINHTIACLRRDPAGLKRYLCKLRPRQFLDGPVLGKAHQEHLERLTAALADFGLASDFT